MFRSQKAGPRKRRRRVREPHRRRLAFEPLEDRRLLAVVTVDTELDRVDFNDGVTSLREAIFATNVVPGADEIVFDFGHDGPATILLEHGELEITEALTITGDGRDLLTIDAQQQSRIFNITAATGDFTIAGMTLTNGRAGTGGAISTQGGTLTVAFSTISGNAAGIGGGVDARGDVTVTDSTISGNSTDFWGGGGIRAFGDVTVTSSMISGNFANGKYGGGIHADGDVTVTSSTVSGNSVRYGARGGGISGYSVTVTSSTISGNSVQYGGGGGGGGIFARDAATVAFSTISGNSSSLSGGGISAGYHAAITIRNSIVAGNSGVSYPDLRPVTGPVVVEYSLIGDNTGTGLVEAPIGSPDANGNLIGGPINGIIDPKLGPLADNGGPTKTHAVLVGSPALDAGDPSAVAGVDGVPEFDQRGMPFGRVTDGDGVSGARIDIGAYERQPGEVYTLVVDTLADELDGDYSPGDFSLREAIAIANLNPGSDTIEFDAALTTAGPATILLMMGELVLTDSLTINGPAASLLTIDAQQRSRIFNITSQSGDFTIEGMTLTGGRSIDYGGAISVDEGDLMIISTTIIGNSTGISGNGGGILAIGNVTVVSSTISENSSGFSGGGISASGNVTVVSSTLSGNSATFAGGGILAGGDVSISYSTISDNAHSGIRAERDLTVASSTILKNGGIGIQALGNVSVRTSTISENVGSGIRADGDVTVTSSTISGNSTRFDGGGIWTSANVTITDSTISGNSALSSSGGGISARGDVTVTSSTIVGNSAVSSSGGGISAGGDVSVTSSTISENSAAGSGGGIVASGRVTVISSTISGNSAFDSGGGVFATGVTVFSTTISGNSATTWGGGIFARDDVTVSSTTISGNSVTTLGGGIFTHGNVTVSSSTIAGNLARSGGGIHISGYFDDSDLITITNSIVAANRAQGSYPDLSPASAEITVEYSLIGDANGLLVSGTNILIGVDPLLGPLADNGGPTQTHALLPGSPAINRGDPAAMASVGDIPEFDQRGAPYSRVRGGRIDMGAHEWQGLNVEVQSVPSPTVTPVDEVTIEFTSAISGFDLADLTLSLNGGENLLTGTETLTTSDDQTFILDGLAEVTARAGYYTLTLVAAGSGIVDASGAPLDAGDNVSWAMGRFVLGLTVDTLVDEADGRIDDGDISLRDAIAAAAPGETIGFAASLDGGTIQLTLGELLITRRITIDATALPTGLAIDASGLDPTPDSTQAYFDDDTDDGDGSRIFDIDDGNALIDSPVAIRGLTLTGGDVAGGGGAIRARESLDVTSSTIWGNSAANGGGIWSDRDVTLSGTTIRGNSADEAGGIQGIGDVTVNASTISGNVGSAISASGDVSVTSSTVAENGGKYSGGIDALGDVSITSSTISGNGGFGIRASRSLAVTSSTISGNSKYGVEGGGGDVTVTSSTVSGNSGGIRGGYGGPITIENSIVAGNGLNSDVRTGTGPLVVEYSLIGNNSVTSLAEAPVGSPDANGNLIGGPINGIIDPKLGPLANNGGPTKTRALLPGSPALDAGDPNFIPPPDLDQRGEGFPRVADAGGGLRIDMGAYESQGVPTFAPGDYNQNGKVDAADYSVWRDRLGQASVSPFSGADGDGDGIIDGDDYGVWKLHFGETLRLTPAGSGAAASTAADPERQIGESKVAVGRELNVTQAERIAGRGQAVGVAVIEARSREQHRGPESNQRTNRFRAIQADADDLLLLAVDRVGRSARQGNQVSNDHCQGEHRSDDVNSQSQLNEPLAVALAAWP